MARTSSADLLKGIAALLMVQVHIIELFASEAIFKSDIGKLLLFLGGPPVAPVFLLFLGYFIASSQKTTQQLIVRGIKIIVLGLALNIALNLNLIISVYKGEYPYITIPEYLFGVDVLPHAGLSIIIIAVLKKIIDKSIVIPIFLALTAAFMGNMLLTFVPEQHPLLYLLAFIYGDGWWSYFPLLPWLSYSLAGLVFYKAMQQFDFSYFSSFRPKIIMTVLFLLFCVFTIQYAVSVASDLQSYYHHGIIFFCWTIVFLIFYVFFASQTVRIVPNNSVFSYLQWLGKNITAFYVIQWIIIGNTATEIYKSIASPMWLLAAFIGIFGISSGLCYLWNSVEKHYLTRITRA